MLRDFRGAEITVGATIIYAVKDSTYPYVVEAIVTAIGETGHTYGRRTHYVKAHTTGRSSLRGPDEPQERERQVTLTAIERIVMLHP